MRTSGPSAGQTWVYFLSPWGMQLELLSYPQGKGYEVLGILERAVCSIVDLSGASSPDLMRVLDQEFGNEVTTRGWPTVERVLRALEG